MLKVSDWAASQPVRPTRLAASRCLKFCEHKGVVFPGQDSQLLHSFPPGPPVPALKPGCVQVWYARWTERLADLNELAAVLAPEEQARAQRFRFERDRNRYIAGRAILRQLLSRYTGVPPAEIQLGYGHRGKPFLPACPELEFNMSDAGELLAYAFRLQMPVGIDIEVSRPQLDSTALAQRYFHPLEVRALLEEAPESRHAAFLRCWTRKEAFVKAIGEGLRFGLDRFAVPIREGEGCVLVDPSGGEPRNWKIFELRPGPNYFGAVVTREPVAGIVEWTVPRW